MATKSIIETLSIVAVQGLASDPKKSWVWKSHSKADKKAVERGESVNQLTG